MDESKTRAERIAQKVRKKQHMIRVAMGEEKADLVLKHATYVNVFSDELCEGDIAVADGLVVGMGEYEGIEEVDVRVDEARRNDPAAHINLLDALVLAHAYH